MVALIPARAGSKRCPGKNTRLLNGHPLIAYTIAAAKQADIFDQIAVCTDINEAELRHPVFAGVRLVFRWTASDDQADIVWITQALRSMNLWRSPMLTYAILRPTSPFRTAETIRRAYKRFRLPGSTEDSIRAVEPVKQHPGKMWEWMGPGYPITPLLNQKRPDGVPWHSSPTQTLPTFYAQNACLEMGWGANIWQHGTIHGRKVAPFFTEGYEGFDVNTEDDWRAAEALAAETPALLPPVSLEGLPADPQAQREADPGRSVAG